MIQLANGFGRFLQLLVIAQPAANLGNQFGTDAELPGTATRIADGQNGLRMSFTTGALGAAAGMTGRALDEGTAQDFARAGEAFEEPFTGLDGLLMRHLSR